MVMLTNLELIRRVPLFAMLSPDQARSVADSVTKKRFKRGEILVEQGKKSDCLYILLTGRARVLSCDAKGREVILATLKAGDHLGEMSLIDNQTHSATVRTEVQTDALVLDRFQFAKLLPENTSMAYAVMRGLVQRLRVADRKIESLALMDVYGRVARALIESATDMGDGKLQIREKISRQDIAKMVGASREMVSRVMKDLEEQGFIVTLPDGGMLVRDRLSTLE